MERLEDGQVNRFGGADFLSTPGVERRQGRCFARSRHRRDTCGSRSASQAAFGDPRRRCALPRRGQEGSRRSNAQPAVGDTASRRVRVGLRMIGEFYPGERGGKKSMSAQFSRDATAERFLQARGERSAIAPRLNLASENHRRSTQIEGQLFPTLHRTVDSGPLAIICLTCWTYRYSNIA